MQLRVEPTCHLFVIAGTITHSLTLELNNPGPKFDMDCGNFQLIFTYTTVELKSLVFFGFTASHYYGIP